MNFIKPILLSLLFASSFSIVFDAFGQENKKVKTTYVIAGSEPTENTRLVASDSIASKSFSTRKYSNAQYKWVDNYCFSVSEYDWQNSEINLHLDKTLKYRRKANTNAILGVTSAVFGLGINGLARLINDMKDYDKSPPRTIIFPFIASGGFFIAAGINSKKKKDQLAQLKLLRSK